MLHIAAAVLINTTARGDIGNWHDLALCNQEITTMYHGDRRGGGLPRKQKHRSLQLDSIQKTTDQFNLQTSFHQSTSKRYA